MAGQMETGAAVALTGFALWEMYEAYGRAAPTLGELRTAHRDDVEHRQRLLDADLCVGGLAVLAGGIASWLTRSWVPVLAVAAGFAWISLFHHIVMGSLTPDQIP